MESRIGHAEKMTFPIVNALNSPAAEGPPVIILCALNYSICDNNDPYGVYYRKHRLLRTYASPARLSILLEGFCLDQVQAKCYGTYYSGHLAC